MKINVILTPLIKNEIPLLLTQIRDIPIPAKGYVTSWVISIDGIWSDQDKQEITQEFNKNKKLKSCTNLYFISCKIPPNESVYIKKIDPNNPVNLLYGMKSGPNIQFLKSISHLVKYKSGDAVILLETDAIPLSDCWLEIIGAELADKDFFVAGSEYKGHSKLPDSISGHINGNAVYNISHLDFPKFLQCWDQILKYCITKDPSLAYDVVIPWAIYYKNGISFDAIDFIESSFVNRFLKIEGILNVSGEFENSKKYVVKSSEFLNKLNGVAVLHSKAALNFKKEVLLQHKISNYCLISGGIVAYANSWQYPAITEQHAYECMSCIISDNTSVIYFAFPWATLIDLKVHNPESQEAKDLEYILHYLASFLKTGYRVLTVCQHIFMNDFEELFREAGITDVFWSHKTIGGNKFTRFPNINVHAFPLYPVQKKLLEDKLIPFYERSYDFSFVGAKAKYVGANAKGVYLSNSRNYIIDLLSDTPGAYVKGREQWHFEKIVYDRQISGKVSVTERVNENEEEYKLVLKNSRFSLCPSGTGPNSIRLWETLSYESIPVVLADSYCFPGDEKLWDSAVVKIEESIDNIKNLPEFLRELAKDKDAVERFISAGRQLWKKYGADYFVSDIHTLIIDLHCDKSRVINEKSYKDSTALPMLMRSIKKCSGVDENTARFLLLVAGNAALISPLEFRKLWIKDSELFKIIAKCISIADAKSISNFHTVMKSRNFSLDLS